MDSLELLETGDGIGTRLTRLYIRFAARMKKNLPAKRQGKIRGRFFFWRGFEGSA